MIYLLDTNTCIAIIKHQPETIQDRLTDLSVDEVAMFTWFKNRELVDLCFKMLERKG